MNLPHPHRIAPAPSPPGDRPHDASATRAVPALPLAHPARRSPTTAPDGERDPRRARYRRARPVEPAPRRCHHEHAAAAGPRAGQHQCGRTAPGCAGRRLVHRPPRPDVAHHHGPRDLPALPARSTGADRGFAAPSTPPPASGSGAPGTKTTTTPSRTSRTWKARAWPRCAWHCSSTASRSAPPCLIQVALSGVSLWPDVPAPGSLGQTRCSSLMAADPNRTCRVAGTRTHTSHLRAGRRAVQLVDGMSVSWAWSWPAVADQLARSLRASSAAVFGGAL